MHKAGEKFSAHTIVFPGVPDGVYDHPTGIALLPPDELPTLLVANAGHHADLYEEYADSFLDPSLAPHKLSQDKSLIAVGWRSHTNHLSTIVLDEKRINSLPERQQNIARLAACALSLALRHHALLSHPDGQKRTMQFSLGALNNELFESFEVAHPHSQ